jgi:putative zinc finger/helix-turn-helix YgiT family protein
MSAASETLFEYPCPECGRGVVETTKIRNYKTKIKGYPFIVDEALMGICTHCKTENFAPEETERWERLFYQTLEERRAFLSAEEITQLRTALGLSMEDFARLIGATRQSLSTWEKTHRGSPPSRTADLLMKLVKASVHTGTVDVTTVLLEEAKKWGLVIELRRPKLRLTKEPRIAGSVEQVFHLQEQCLQHTLPLVMEQFTFVKSCIELIVNRHLSTEVLNELDEQDRERIRGVHTYLNETLSHLIISLKLALYGAHVESLSILRNALERMTNMAAMVENQKLKHPLKYKTAVQKIKAREEIQKLYDALSKSAVHVEKSISQRFDLGSKSYPRLGMAIDSEETSRVMRELMKASLYVVRVLTSFYNLKRDIVGEAYFQQAKSLEDKFSSLI